MIKNKNNSQNETFMIGQSYKIIYLIDYIDKSRDFFNFDKEA